MTRVRLDGVTKRYGEAIAVDRVSLDVLQGELLVLLGPSGCGKTTTLRIVAGFIEASEGRVHLGARDITDEPPYRRNIGIVFQSFALFPHMTVFENVAFGLRRRRRPVAEIRRRVGEMLELVRMEALAQRMPRQLSGGQQQRVAIARALAIGPDVLLLDEPLSALDAKLRHEVRQEIKQLQQLSGITTVLVTHDQDEAMSLGDRLAVMNEGRVQQVGAPEALYRRPANRFVAGFIGRGTFLDGRLAGGGRFVTPSGLVLACAAGAATGANELMIRPEAIEAVSPDADGTAAGGPNVLDAAVERATFLGPTVETALRLPTGERLEAEIPAARLAGHALAAGETIRIRIDPAGAVPIAAERT
jgi:putative spermidine/putrescine transport system ATP-binding protein